MKSIILLKQKLYYKILQKVKNNFDKDLCLKHFTNTRYGDNYQIKF